MRNQGANEGNQLNPYIEAKKAALALGLRRLLPVACLLTTCATQAAPLQCPALDANGKPAQLAPPAVVLRLEQAELREPVPADLARQAADIVGFFEHGAGNPWVGVSGQEELSVGFMQWNWRTGSLVTRFLKSVPDDALLEAPEGLRMGLETLKRAGKKGSASHAHGVAVIGGWRKAVPGDPLLGSGLRRSVVADLKEWLAKPAVTGVQRQLVEDEMRKSYALARRWATDRSTADRTVQVDAQLLAYFFDLVTFNGGTGGLWTVHVDALIHQYPNSADMIDAASAWLLACVKYRSPLEVRNRSLYNVKDAAANAARWRDSVAQNDRAFSKEQLSLFALAWLRAQRSTGSDPPRAFPGVYQADVMSRRGTLALGLGQVHGARWPVN